MEHMYTQWFQVILKLAVDPRPTRVIEHMRTHQRFHRVLMEENYLMGVEDIYRPWASIYYSRLSKKGFWKQHQDLVTSLEHFLAYPSSAIDAERYLLLGPNENEKMRLLTVPHGGRAPEIRSLSLTFAEAKLRLDKEWEAQHSLKERERNQHIRETGTVDANENEQELMQIGTYHPSQRSAQSPEAKGESPYTSK